METISRCPNFRYLSSLYKPYPSLLSTFHLLQNIATQLFIFSPKVAHMLIFYELLWNQIWFLFCSRVSQCASIPAVNKIRQPQSNKQNTPGFDDSIFSVSKSLTTFLQCFPVNCCLCRLLFFHHLSTLLSNFEKNLGQYHCRFYPHTEHYFKQSIFSSCGNQKHSCLVWLNLNSGDSKLLILWERFTLCSLRKM